MRDAGLKAGVDRLYGSLASGEGLQSSIRPWVGGHFEAPVAHCVRVLTVGINSYLSESDEPGHPGWFPAWVEKREHRYFPMMQDEAARIGEALARHAGGGHSYTGPDGLYATNAVKRFLPYDGGRHARDVDERWFDEGARTWRAELLLLAEHGALPQAIVVFGLAAWEPTWRPLAELCAEEWASEFLAYRPMEAGHAWFHRVNRVDVRDAGADARTMLVVRLDHPAARRRFVAGTVVDAVPRLLG